MNARNAQGRGIGPVGTFLRVAGATALIFVAGAADGLPWDVGWLDVALGLVGLPAISVAALVKHD